MIKQCASEGHLDDTSNCTVHSYKHFKVRSLFLIPRERILSATRHCPETKPHSVVSRFQASVGRPKEACQWSAFPSLTSRVSSFWDVCWTLVIVSLGKPSGKQILLHPSHRMSAQAGTHTQAGNGNKQGRKSRFLCSFSGQQRAGLIRVYKHIRKKTWTEGGKQQGGRHLIHGYGIPVNTTKNNLRIYVVKHLKI